MPLSEAFSLLFDQFSGGGNFGGTAGRGRNAGILERCDGHASVAVPSNE